MAQVSVKRGHQSGYASLRVLGQLLVSAVARPGTAYAAGRREALRGAGAPGRRERRADICKKVASDDAMMATSAGHGATRRLFGCAFLCLSPSVCRPECVAHSPHLGAPGPGARGSELWRYSGRDALLLLAHGGPRSRGKHAVAVAPPPSARPLALAGGEAVGASGPAPADSRVGGRGSGGRAPVRPPHARSNSPTPASFHRPSFPVE